MIFLPQVTSLSVSFKFVFIGFFLNQPAAYFRLVYFNLKSWV